MKRILVTGGQGFIGGYVVEELLSRGYTPVIFDHHKKVDGLLPEGCDYFIGDVRDDVAMIEAVAHTDGAIHLAAVLGTQECIGNPRPAAQSNLMGGLNFLEAVAQYDIPGVYIAVGNYWMNNPYSITKNMIERFTFMYNKDRGTRVNIVRAVNAYGPRQSVAAPFGSSKVRKITPSFVCRALTNQPIEIYGDGENISDMVYVGDVAKALVSALEKAEQGKVFHEAVECGPQESHTVKEVAELIIKLTGSTAGIKHLPMRPGEQAGVDVTANFFTLGLVDMDADELVSLEDGMTKTVEYYKEWLGKQSS
jgi:nucleoside-diphosphate-sugar epimerase